MSSLTGHKMDTKYSVRVYRKCEKDKIQFLEDSWKGKYK